MGRVYSLAELAEEYKQLGARRRPAIKRGILAGAERARAFLVQETQRKAFDRGVAARSWKYELTVTPDKMRLTIYNQAPYYSVLERGRRAGAKPPPYKVLIPWVRRHITTQHTYKSGARKVSGDKAVGIAIAIAKSIGKRGQRGKFILAEAQPKILTFVLIEVRGELARAAGGG